MELSKYRFKFFTFIVVLFGFALSFRLFQKQVLQKDYYTALAKKQYTVTKELTPTRGKIYLSDYQGEEATPVAINLHFYDLLIVPKNVLTPKDTARKISGYIGMSEKEIFDQIDTKKPYIPPIKKKIDGDTAKKIEDLGLSGVMLVPNMWRYYPENTLACFVLGFVDSENVGRYGAEGYYNKELKGQESEVSVDKENLGPYFYLDGADKVNNGSDIYLTIDRNIQFMAEQKLKEGIKNTKAESGSMIIIEPKTGKVMAMASEPNFDPNKYNDQKSVDIFNNPSIAYSYEPGSIFKIITMAAALDSGKVTPETEGVFGSYIKIGGYTIKTSTGQAYGRENMTQVLEHSDNIAMVWVSQQLGEENFYKYIRDFGFGGKTKIDLDSEASGQVLELTKWREVNAATMAFGQGIAVTPIQIASAFAAIANKGKLMETYVVDKIVDPSQQVLSKDPKSVRQIIKEDTAQKIKDMMISVVENGHGKKARVAGYWVAGKTGTAQIPDPQKNGYLEGLNIGSFAGFAPANDPKFAMLVKIDKPKTVEWAESSAAPIFGSMAEWLLNYFEVPKER